MDYQLLDYRPAELVKLDVYLADKEFPELVNMVGTPASVLIRFILTKYCNNCILEQFANGVVAYGE